MNLFWAMSINSHRFSTDKQNGMHLQCILDELIDSSKCVYNPPRVAPSPKSTPNHIFVNTIRVIYIPTTSNKHIYELPYKIRSFANAREM